jgi:septal ring factor EnvC (AmiA/AmiB activator)
MEKKELKTKDESKKWGKPLFRNIVTGAVFLILVFISLIILLSKNSQINHLVAEQKNFNSLIKNRDSVINDLDGTISQIEDNLTFIKNKRGQLELDRSEGGSERKERIIKDIALMNTMLEESEKKIEELNDKLASSDVDIKSFRSRISKLTKELEEQNKVISQLQKELEERDFQIAEMGEKVTQLEDRVMVLTDTVIVINDSLKKSSEQIDELDRKLHRAYWAYGTFKELKEHGVAIREGGVLGIVGTNKTLRKDLNDQYFTELDIRHTKTIPLNVDKANIISEHSDSSYHFVYQDNKIAYLEIENPEEFWKLTKYAVIEVK